MNQESNVKSLYQTVEKLNSRIELLEQHYTVLSGLYGISLSGMNIRNRMARVMEEISALFSKLEKIDGGQKKLAILKEKYNLMAKLWENVLKNGRPRENNITKRARRFFKKYRR
ncbi:MAG: hypothetical protein COT24_05375 [Candidatus Kerfeldbacteria bacterium CG08_land_8_20_14_0_20_40_16]|uniref:Uncharacterized protein n=1 Tax=Candidatus Kerfeldbacteria bacterium CG08_land_8_20_14_0_20_40_16 TaxID=2014244 RepID=A0A2H0YU97_9BACT|nr:MAG: hypothetical protein COT24_05375 [Candidatus Kerfeldbacteria bacterium CG08_land_8_20_14_0_20_40_16]